MKRVNEYPNLISHLHLLFHMNLDKFQWDKDEDEEVNDKDKDKKDKKETKKDDNIIENKKDDKKDKNEDKGHDNSKKDKKDKVEVKVDNNSNLALENFGRIKLVVGQITKAWKHETADKLLCEEINIGNETRKISSGLVGY